LRRSDIPRFHFSGRIFFDSQPPNQAITLEEIAVHYQGGITAQANSIPAFPFRCCFRGLLFYYVKLAPD
jgi:hypothetical protein